MNYYEILRIPSTATMTEIKNAYKKLVKKYHPDIYEGNKIFAESKIKEINEAYETLSEKNKKAIYDAELNYKKYEAPKEEFVKTYTTEDIKNYKNVYYNVNSRKIKRKEVVPQKSLFSFNELAKKYWFKLDNFFDTEEKENIVIFILSMVIITIFFGILYYLV